MQATCPSCHAEFDASDQRGLYVGCPSCAAVFFNKPAAPSTSEPVWAEPVDAEPAKALPVELSSPPLDLRPKRKSSTTWIWAVVGCVVLIGLIGVVGMVGFVVYAVSKPLDWQEYHSAEGHYRVKMPGKPVVSKQVEGSMTLDVAQVQVPLRDTGFFVHYFATEPLAPHLFFAQLDKNVLSDFPNGRLVDKKSVDADGYPAREYRIEIGTRIKVVRRFICTPKYIYFVTVSSSTLKFDSPEIATFMDSFHVEKTDRKP